MITGTHFEEEWDAAMCSTQYLQGLMKLAVQRHISPARSTEVHYLYWLEIVFSCL